jgi:hypothetical protein
MNFGGRKDESRLQRDSDVKFAEMASSQVEAVYH